MGLSKTLSPVRRKFLKISKCTLTCFILAEFSTSFPWQICCIGSDTSITRHNTSCQEEKWQLFRQFRGSQKENQFSTCLQQMKKFLKHSEKLANWRLARNKTTREFYWCPLCSCISSQPQTKQATEWHRCKFLWKSKAPFALRLWCQCSPNNKVSASPNISLESLVILLEWVLQQ